MSQSILLHALSLNDRILEPNKLPLCGHVWAFDKASMSKEMFVGNCISVLSLLGSVDASINWENNIMAFDTRLNGRMATVLISLQDDSLASDYYYFFGVWIAPDGALEAQADWLAEPVDWDQEEVSAPAISFTVTVADKPLQLPQIKKMIGGEVFAENICHGTFKLYGSISVYPQLSGCFMMCPTMHASNHGRFEIRHSLYSMRNLMALAGRVMEIHEGIQQYNGLQELSQDMQQLMQMLDNDTIKADSWDAMARESGRIALLTISEEMACQKKRINVGNLLKLFEAIEAELDVSEISGMPSLAARMKMPFNYARRLIDERLALMGGMHKQGAVLQSQIHNRMLAAQQIMLNKLLRQ